MSARGRYLCHAKFFYNAEPMQKDDFACYVIWEGPRRGIHPSFSLIHYNEDKSVRCANIRAALKHWYGRCMEECCHLTPPPLPDCPASQEIWLQWRSDKDDDAETAKAELAAARASARLASASAPGRPTPLPIREEALREMARALGTEYRASAEQRAEGAAPTHADFFDGQESNDWESVAHPRSARTPSPVKIESISTARPRRASPTKRTQPSSPTKRAQATSSTKAVAFPAGPVDPRSDVEYPQPKSPSKRKAKATPSSRSASPSKASRSSPPVKPLPLFIDDSDEDQGQSAPSPSSDDDVDGPSLSKRPQGTWVVYGTPGYDNIGFGNVSSAKKEFNKRVKKGLRARLGHAEEKDDERLSRLMMSKARIS